MSNNKQSSIEWLFEQIKNHIDAEDGSMGMNWLHDGTLEQAKAMHKEEVIDAHGVQYDYSYSQIDPKKVTGEQYYNETYGC